MPLNIKPEQEIDMIRGKLLVNKATKQEIFDFLNYVAKLENLVEQASQEDFFGSEGWRHLIGWND